MEAKLKEAEQKLIDRMYASREASRAEANKLRAVVTELKESEELASRLKYEIEQYQARIIDLEAQLKDAEGKLVDRIHASRDTIAKLRDGQNEAKMCLEQDMERKIIAMQAQMQTVDLELLKRDNELEWTRSELECVNEARLVLKEQLKRVQAQSKADTKRWEAKLNESEQKLVDRIYAFKEASQAEAAKLKAVQTELRQCLSRQRRHAPCKCPVSDVMELTTSTNPYIEEDIEDDMI